MITLGSLPCGWFDEDDQYTLANLAQCVPEKGIIVELGAFHGRSTVLLARNAPKSIIISVDLWEDINLMPQSLATLDDSVPNPGTNLHQRFLANTKEYKNVIGHKDSFEKFNPDMKVDMMFFDSHWDYSLNYMLFHRWWDKLKPNGILCGHDYATYNPGMVKAVNQFATDKELAVRTSLAANPLERLSFGKVWYFFKP